MLFVYNLAKLLPKKVVCQTALLKQQQQQMDKVKFSCVCDLPGGLKDHFCPQFLKK